MVVEQVTSQPYRMEDGSVTAVKLTIFWEGDNPAPPEEEIIEINPVPFSELGRITGALSEHIAAKAEFEELKERYEPLKEKCRRTYKEVEAIIKKPALEKESLNLHEKPETLIVSSEEKPAHEEATTDLSTLTPQQQAESIYDKVLEQFKGKITNGKHFKAEEKDIKDAVIKAGVPEDQAEQVSKEFIGLLTEKGAIKPSMLSRILGGGRKKKEAEEQC